MPDQFKTMLTDVARVAEEAGPMRSSAVIRRRGQQRRRHQHVAVGALSALAVAVVVATGSFLAMHRSATTLPAGPVTPYPTGPVATAHASPTPGASAGSPSATPSLGNGANPAAATGTHLVVSLGGLSANVLTIGGPAVQFTVTVTNPTGYTFRNIAPNVSVGHCTCSDGPVRVAPEGTLQWRRPDGSWQALEYAGAGADPGYVNAVQVPGFTLAPGATASFTYRMAFPATQQGTYHNGQTSIDVTMVGLVGYSAVGPVTPVASPGTPGAHAMAVLGGLAPQAWVPIQVATG